MNFNTVIDPTIFRDYDIRGIYPHQINEEVFYILGRAAASYLKVDEIALGHDMRLSSPSLFEALCRGIRTQGVDVVDLGLISTEMHYFASGKYKFPANMIISASHNPSSYNGLKIVTSGAVPLHAGFGLPEIKKLALEQKFFSPSKKGKMTKKSILGDWVNHALSFINPTCLKPFKVVIDAGNGMGGISWSKAAKRLPIEIIPLYFEPDGHFPYHLPDPLKPQNLVDSKKTIRRHKADIGLAIDGDADRLFVIDEKGVPLSGTITTAILAAAMLEKCGGPGTVLYNAVCGRIVPETIKRFDGTPIRVRVGHSFIKEYMKTYNALFAGEHSGHFYFRDNYFADSAFIAGLIFLEFLSVQNQRLSSITKKYNKYPASGEINFKISSPNKIFPQLESKFQDAISTDYIDGLSVWYPTWWFNLRVSKTEPLVRLNVEANDSKLLENNLKKLEKAIITLGGEKV